MIIKYYFNTLAYRLYKSFWCFSLSRHICNDIHDSASMDKIYWEAAWTQQAPSQNRVCKFSTQKDPRLLAEYIVSYYISTSSDLHYVLFMIHVSRHSRMNESKNLLTKYIHKIFLL